MKCKVCGKEFTPSKDSRTLCSNECRVIGKRINVKKYAKKKSQEKQLMLGTRNCEVCGKEFHPRTGRQVRCSNNCTAQIRNQQTVENKRAKRMLCVEDKKLRRSKEARLVEFAVQAWEEGRTSYGKYEMQGYLEQQSMEMAKRRRELDAEWERKRRIVNGQSALAEGIK